MKTFGQVITKARKKAGLTQKEVAGRLKREDGRLVDAPYLNAMERDRRYPPSNHLIDQLAEMLGVPADLLYFHAKRLPADIKRDVDNEQVEASRHVARGTVTSLASGLKAYTLPARLASPCLARAAGYSTAEFSLGQREEVDPS
jgi:transcriptional regulator with XRE-family HTH domain